MTPELERLFRISWKKSEAAYRYLGRKPDGPTMTPEERDDAIDRFAEALDRRWNDPLRALIVVLLILNAAVWLPLFYWRR